MPADRQPAPDPRRGFSDPLLDAADPARVLRFLLRPTTRWVFCWIIALASTVFMVFQAWHMFDDPERADGNWGFATIDFGGQWVAGRMIVEGHGRQLYNRNYLRPLVEAHYPAGCENPTAVHNDAENLMLWMAGRDDRVMIGTFFAPLAAHDALDESALLAAGCDLWTPKGLEDVVDPHPGGSLYPPIHALLFSPISTMRPRVGYRVWQAAILLLTFLDGWLVHRLTAGRVWWPVAVVMLFMFPGYVGCLNLGQNSAVSLTVLLLGWWQLGRGRPVLAGVLWGLLAFKPVWAVSFFLVPLWTRRWRMAAAMAATGLAQIALTLPVVGWENWVLWLRLGREAGAEYAVQENWIMLSRDLLGLPRRGLLTFEGGLARDEGRGPAAATAIGAALWVTVLVLTLLVVWLRRRRIRVLEGPPAAFVLIGALFTCYHFMYYDFLLAGLSVLLLFTCPGEYFRPTFWRRPRWLGGGPGEALPPDLWRYYQPTFDDPVPPPVPLMPGGRRPRWVRAPLPPLLLVLMMVAPAVSAGVDPTNHFPPGETYALLALWAWCGYRTLRGADESAARPAAVPGGASPAQLAELGTDVGGAHQGLADQHGADAGRP